MTMMADPQRPVRFGPESQRVLQLLFCMGAVAVTWFLLGFRPSYSAMGNDAGKAFLPILSILHHVHGDWRALVYRPEYFGGSNLLGLRGVLPLSVLLTRAGLSPLWTLNIDLLVAQALIGYFSIESVRLIVDRADDTVSRRDMIVGACIVWLAAFSPLMGWRVYLGHPNLIYGFAGFAALIGTWLAVAAQKLTRVTAVIALITLLQAFCVQGFQVLILGAVFCVPLLAGVALSEPRIGFRRMIRASLACVAFAIVALLMAAPVFLAMVHYATSIDTTREPGQDVAIYSYFVAGWRELAEVLMWFGHGLSHLEGSRPVESRYGLGPVLILMALLANRRQWPVVAGVVFSVATGALLVANIQPVSGWILHIPAVEDFRVPMRLFIAVTWFCTVLLCAELVRRFELANVQLDRVTLLGLVLAFGVVLVPAAGVKEVIVWALAFGVLLAILAKRLQVAMAASLVMVFINLDAFSANIEMDRHAGDMLAANRDFGRSIIERYPALKMPLNRVEVDAADFNLDASSVGRLTSITGYGFPHRQFSILIHDLVGVKFSPTRSYFDPTHKIANFYVARQLYNIRNRLEWVSQTRAALVPIGPTPGPVWASRRREVSANQHALDGLLIKTMREPGWPQTQYVTDPGLAGGNASGCEKLDFGVPVFSHHDNRIDVDVRGAAPGPCPVTISMTWSSNLSGFAQIAGKHKPLDFYPAYGALVGFTLPPGTNAVTIRARLSHYGLSLWLAVSGLVLAILLVPLSVRLQ